MPKKHHVIKDFKTRLMLVLKETGLKDTPENRERLEKEISNIIMTNYVPPKYFIMTSLNKETGVVDVCISEQISN